ICDYFAHLAIQEYKISINYYPSLIAATIVYQALYHFIGEDPILGKKWGPEMTKRTRYSKEDMRDSFTLLGYEIAVPPYKKHKLTTIRFKFEDSPYYLNVTKIDWDQIPINPIDYKLKENFLREEEDNNRLRNYLNSH